MTRIDDESAVFKGMAPINDRVMYDTTDDYAEALVTDTKGASFVSAVIAAAGNGGTFKLMMRNTPKTRSELVDLPDDGAVEQAIAAGSSGLLWAMVRGYDEVVIMAKSTVGAASCAARIHMSKS